MNPNFFYIGGFVLLLIGAGQHGIQALGQRFDQLAREKHAERSNAEVHAFFQDNAAQLFPDDEPRRLPPTTPPAAKELTPELADPLDEWATATKTKGNTGWH